jgi:iron uptake system EfeUOB component EfeO/EfeM
MSYRNRYAVCYPCQEKELQGEIKDKKMKKFFNIPEEFYKRNGFLANIKISYLRYGKLTEKQIEAFKKTVAKLKEE